MHLLQTPSIWFLCGSQHLYGPGPLRTVAQNAQAVAKALESDDRLCFLTAQRDPSADDPTPAQFYRAGTIGMLMRARKLS